MRRPRRVVLAVAIAALATGTASAQWVRLQRCGGAIPCMIPFAVRYNPDPLIGGQYGWMSPTGVSGRISLDGKPTVEFDVHRALASDFYSEAARRFVIAHPPPPSPTPSPKTGD